MSEHPWVPGVNRNSSAHDEGAENSTQLSLIVSVLQNCVSAWKRTVDSYIVVVEPTPARRIRSWSLGDRGPTLSHRSNTRTHSPGR